MTMRAVAGPAPSGSHGAATEMATLAPPTTPAMPCVGDGPQVAHCAVRFAAGSAVSSRMAGERGEDRRGCMARHRGTKAVSLSGLDLIPWTQELVREVLPAAPAGQDPRAAVSRPRRARQTQNLQRRILPRDSRVDGALPATSSLCQRQPAGAVSQVNWTPEPAGFHEVARPSPTRPIMRCTTGRAPVTRRSTRAGTRRASRTS